MSRFLRFFQILFLSLTLMFVSCTKTTKTEKAAVSDTYVADNYTKQEVDIEMRDGIELHTTIYSPNDTSI